MKTKIVLWGQTETNEKVLVAVELIESENLVKTYVVEEKDATEVFYNRMLNEWRFGTELEFPEDTKIHEKQLTVSEDILPEGIKVDRPDLIIRAKTEWHFIVLSKKLYDLYQGELEDFKEKIDELSEFDNGLWEELKGFWGKVQSQIREKNLFRNHIESLRKQTDETFNKLKELKKVAEKELREESKTHFSTFTKILEEVEEKIESGLGLQPLFEELKDIQAKFKKTNFSRDHRRQLWDRIDKSFKSIKQKRYGSNQEERTPLARLKRRYEGLLVAIEKMERSISRDKRELNQQGNAASSSFGQLESEIRKVKMSMVEERVQSKQEKLEDMLKTKIMLEGRMSAEQAKEDKRKKFEEAKKEAEDKIAQEIHDRSEGLEVDEEELKKAAEKLSASMHKSKGKKEEKAEKKDSVLDKIAAKVEDLAEEAKEIAEDVIDSVKATAEVLEDKLEDKLEEAGEKFEEIKDKVEEKMEEAGEKFEEIKDKVEEKVEEKMKEAEVVKEELEEKSGDLGEKIAASAEKIEDRIEEVAGKIRDKVKDALSGDEEE